MALAGELQPWEGVWAGGQRRAGCQLQEICTGGQGQRSGCQGHTARLSCGAPRSSASTQRESPGLAPEWTKASPPGGITSEGHDLQENMASRGYHLQGLLGGATDTDHILHFDKMIL